MPTWLAYLALSSDTPVTPVDAFKDSLTSYILGYGILGIVALALAFIVWRGKFVTEERAQEMVKTGRTDLLTQIDYLQTKLAATEKQRDEAMDLARTQLVPLLTSFSTTSGALIPLLQELVRYREVDSDRTRRHRGSAGWTGL